MPNNFLFDGLLKQANPRDVFATLATGETFSYGNMLDASAQIANHLNNLGICKGDRVAVQAPKSLSCVFLYIACVRIGAVYLPLNTAYTASEVQYFLEDAKPRLFVCDPEKEDVYRPVLGQMNIAAETMGQQDGFDVSGTLWQRAKSMPKSSENELCKKDDLAAILYTSGTTGRAKGAMLSHENLLSNAQVLIEHWQFAPDDVLLHALPIFHTHGLFVALNVTILSRSSMIFLNGFDVGEVLEHLPAASCMMGVPTFYTRLLAEGRFTRDLVDHIRLFISGSAPLLSETFTQFEHRTGKRILERYGMTETNMNTSNPYIGERRAGTVGFPLPKTHLKIVDTETNAELPRGEIGVIVVKGPNVFSGYWQMPEKTAEEFLSDGFFITGDLGKFDEDGYVHIVGRAKDLIISGGYNIYPKEIEAVIDNLPSVTETAVIGVPHHDFGEAVVAVVVARDQQHVREEIEATVRENLARFKHPRQVIIVDELPRNAMGKVQKNVLRSKYEAVFAD